MTSLQTTIEVKKPQIINLATGRIYGVVSVDPGRGVLVQDVKGYAVFITATAINSGLYEEVK
jgi:hypothetical protein